MRLKRRQMLSSLGGILMLPGLAALTWCGVSLLQAHVYQERGEAALQREFASGLQPMMTAPPKPGDVLGSIDIPRVGISSAIAEGADSRTLALSVGHIPGTALPGGAGNVALAGHRDTFFRGLRNIRAGDDILLTVPGGTRVYEVESARIVAPEDVSVLNDIGRPVLTLVTCYPFYYIGSAPDRFIVQASLAAERFPPLLPGEK